MDDGGRLGRRRDQACGFAQLTVAGRDDGDVADVAGFAELTVAAPNDGAVAEGRVRSQRRREGRFRSRSVRRFPCGTTSSGIMRESFRAGFGGSEGGGGRSGMRQAEAGLRPLAGQGQGWGFGNSFAACHRWATCDERRGPG